MKTQKQLIREHLQAGKKITHKQAERWPFLCRRLAARICDLRGEGMPIRSRTIKNRCPRTGQRIAYAQYYLED